MKKPLIIKKTYTREFALILCQVWGGAYTDFLGVKLKTHPRYLSFIKEGMAATYRNDKLDEEVGRLFLRHIKRDHNYFQNFYRGYVKRFGELKSLWERSHLKREELLYFINRLSLFWPAVYSSTYIPKDKRFSSFDKKINLKLRKKIDIAAHEASNIIVKTLRHIYPALGDLVYCISLDDLKNNSVSRKKLEKAYYNNLILVEDVLVSPKKFASLKKKYNFDLEPDTATGQQVKGQAAYAGSVRGLVRLVFKRSEMNKFKKGEILVTGMTTPEFLPAMKRAAAFITDEGGITCHAAILARELKKPCIIGTRMATKVFKNGDFIELDAKKGIAKILK